MIKVIFIIMSLIIGPMYVEFAYAENYQFKNFKVNPELYRQYQTPMSKKNSDHRIGVNGKASAIDIGAGESPLMKEIRSYITRNFDDIKEEQLKALYLKRKSFNLGIKNYDGLYWQKPMGTFSLMTDRQIEPNSQPGAPWVVNDILIINIDAVTYLTNLKKNKMISIGEKELGAFAGLQFRRVYNYKYFSNSFDQSIESNFNKLLLSFLFFESADLSLIGPNEVLSKEDMLGFYAGAMANIPLEYGFSLGAGFLVKANKLSSISAHSLAEDDILKTNNFLKLFYDEKKSLSIGAELSLQLDFFNLLKLSLLKMEYSHQTTKGQQAELTFSVDDYYHFISSTGVNSSVKKLMRLQGLDEEGLHDYIKSYNQTRKADKTFNFNFLNQGSATESSSEQVKMKRLTSKKEFLNHTYTRISFKKGWKETLKSMAIQSLIGFDFFQNYMESEKTVTDFKYEVGRKSSYQYTLEKHYMVAKTHRSKYDKYKEGAENFVRDYTLFPSEIATLIQQRKVLGPIKVKAYVDFRSESMEYFDNIPYSRKLDYANKICENRRSMIEQTCYRMLSRLIKKYHRNLKDHDEKMWIFKDILDEVNRYSKSLEEQTLLFDANTVEVRGVIEGRLPGGHVFKQYYSSNYKPYTNPIDAFLYKGLQSQPNLVFHNNF